ncbi:hypothetical protein J7E83_19685 [Arthrobacter sp. ISL-48]|uniref:hypothetical protein n=1 Tax=Arthrobacter sp. ISL-48 TaxID=2819110 RepID=UPI001BE861D6|nr:hypothetical protein [Arthrobacter sp. ISL-48]MBT2534309.1 hypothetical protein [Arthrobacter sp. ISL-48]
MATVSATATGRLCLFVPGAVMFSETRENDQPARETAAGIKRRKLLRFGTLLTAFSAMSGLGANAAHAGPGDKNPPSGYVPIAEKGAASGVATLDLESRIPRGQVPDLSTTYVGLSEKGANSGVATLDSDGVLAQLPKVHASRHAPGGADALPSLVSAVNIVTDYGAKGDGKTSANGGSMTSGTATLTVSSAGFTAADVGKAISVKGAGSAGANLTTTVSGFTSSTIVTLTTSAATTVRAAAVSWGSDDTTAFQNALNYAGPKGLRVFVPKPSSHYALTAALTLNAWHGLVVQGDNWETTELRQYTDNTPVFRWQLDNIHSQTFERLRLTYANVQTYAIGPNSVAFARDNTDGLSSLSGHYHHTFRELKIIGATYGFKVLRSFPGDTTSTNPWWGCEWSKVFFSNINRSCVSLNLGTVGAPCNRFDQIKVFQNQTYKNDGGEACFLLRGEAVMTAIDVEQWHNQVINMPSGNFLHINGLHVEHHYVDDSSGSNRLVYVANVAVQIEGLLVSYDSSDGFSKYAIYADVNSTVTVNGGVLSTPPGGANYLFATPATANAAKLYSRGVNIGTAVSLWTNGSLAITSIIEVDGQPPVLQSSDTLPAAAVAYRGRRYIQLGNGTTTGDQLVQCVLSAAGTYSWKTVVSG